MRSRRLLSSLAFIAIATAFVGTPSNSDAASGSSWEFEARKRGVSVFTKEVEGRQYPTFKGIGKVDAPIYMVLAVIEEADRHKEWMHDCADSKLIDRVDDLNGYVYNLTDAPWPVKDRDVVLKSELVIRTPGKEFVAKFKQSDARSHPLPEDTIRMPRLVGHWKLVALNDTTTMVEYQVNADPAGRIPDWLVETTSKELPMHTILNLREHVEKKGPEYANGMAQWISIVAKETGAQ